MNDYLELKEHLEHGYEAAMHNKKQSQESIKRGQYTDKKKARLEFTKDVNEIDALIKDYEDKATKGANAPTLSKLVNQIIDRIKKNESKFGYPPAYLVEWADSHKSDLYHSSISHASKAGMPTNIPKQRKNPNNIPSNVRNSRIREALSALQNYVNDPYVKDTEVHNNLASAYIKANEKESHGRENKNHVTSYGPGGNVINSEFNRLMERAGKKNKAARSAVNSLLSSGVLSNEEALKLKSILKANDRAVISDRFSQYYVTDIMSYLESFLKHDDLEHGWFTDLFKKKPTYTSTGSTAGMPSNIPVGRDTSSAAASSFTDQLAKLTNNLYQYELEERKSKEAYERYRKLVNDTKKEISRVEKLRNNAVANSLTSVQKPIHADKPAKYQHLPQGSKAGMPTNIPRKK